MSNITSTSTINFFSDTVTVVEVDKIIYIPIKPICENLGIDYKTQLDKINSDSVLSKARGLIPLATNSGAQSTLCLPLKYMYGWLMKLNPSKVAPHVSDKLIQYQELIYDVIYDHFHPKQEISTILPNDIANVVLNGLKPIIIDHLNTSTDLISRHNTQINALYDGFLKLAHQQDTLVEHQDVLITEIKEAFQIVKNENLSAINNLKNSIVKLNTNSATPNGRMVTLGELKRDPALGSVVARFISNRSSQSLAQSLVFWTEHNGQKLGKSGSANLYPYDLAITFFDETINPYIKKYI